jgi:hypothetical protein
VVALIGFIGYVPDDIYLTSGPLYHSAPLASSEDAGVADPHVLAPGGDDCEPRQTSLITRLLLDLEDGEGIHSGVDDPGGPGEADVGDAVFGL